MSEHLSDRTSVHQETVRGFSRMGGPLDAAGAYASTANPRWFRGGNVQRPTLVRDELHGRLLAEARAEFATAARERRAIVLAGPPGAGKSTVLREVLAKDQDSWLAIDSDEFKHKLLREAQADGSYEGFLKPAAVREREAAGERFFPLELAALVHEESSFLAMRLQQAALDEGVNVVVDTVLSRPKSAIALGTRLARAGYRVEVIDVEVPYEVSQERIAGRWREAYERAMSTGEGLGGRWVPSVYASTVFDSATGRSTSQEAAVELAQTCPVVQRYRRFWTPAQDAPQVVEVDQSRRVEGGPLLDTVLVQAASRGQSHRSLHPSPRSSGPER